MCFSEQKFRLNEHGWKIVSFNGRLTTSQGVAH